MSVRYYQMMGGSVVVLFSLGSGCCVFSRDGCLDFKGTGGGLWCRFGG
jgi:hypothetical protein